MKTHLASRPGPVVTCLVLAFGALPARAQIAQEAYLKASNPGAGDLFGRAVAMSGDTLVVGAEGERSNATGVNGNQNNEDASRSGAVYVFVHDGTSWVQQAYLKASNTGTFDSFGWSVAISGDTLVVGALEEDSLASGVDGDQLSNAASNAGAAYVFVRSGTTWSQQAYLKASNTAANDTFGWSVAISGDTLVIGAPGEDSSAIGVGGDQLSNAASSAGAAYVFVRNGTTWSQQAYLKATNTGASDRFGIAVAVSADTVSVGADSEDGNATVIGGDQANNAASAAGAAYVYVRSGTVWTPQAYIKPFNTAAGSNFGAALSLSGETLVVSAQYEDSSSTGVGGDPFDASASASGAAYVFVRSGGAWSQQAYIKASNTGAFDQFGEVLALDGDTLVVGAQHEDSTSVGVNGDQGDAEEGAGAAYVFTRNAGSWSQQAYLKASNTHMFGGDLFGSAVAVSGTRILVGAAWEDSGASGVNGNSYDESQKHAGAAFLFGPLSGVTAFCAGDGLDPNVTVPCPCANFGAPGHGCGNSVSTGGALLASTGTTDPDTLELTVTDVPPGVSTIFLQGDGLAAGGAHLGDGVRCAGGTLSRLGLKDDSDLDGSTSFGPASGDPQISLAGGVLLDRVYVYQTYYRNPDPTWCPPMTFNISSGILIKW